MEIAITWRELLIAIVLAAFAYVLEVAVFSHLGKRRAGRQQDELVKKYEVLSQEIQAVRHRLDLLEDRSGQSQEAFERVRGPAYDDAIQYARQGVIASEIASRCGISRDEAALIVSLHGPNLEAGAND